MNAFDTVVDTVLALLRQAPAVTTGPIDEDIDLASLPEATQEAISVSLAGSDPQDPTVLLGAPIDWITAVQIECYARADARSAAGRASRVLHGKVYQRLLTSNPVGSAIVGADVRQPTIRTDQQVMDTRTGVTVAVYPVLHRTVGGTLNSPTA